MPSRVPASFTAPVLLGLLSCLAACGPTPAKSPDESAEVVRAPLAVFPSAELVNEQGFVDLPSDLLPSGEERNTVVKKLAAPLITLLSCESEL